MKALHWTKSFKILILCRFSILQGKEELEVFLELSSIFIGNFDGVYMCVFQKLY